MENNDSKLLAQKMNILLAEIYALYLKTQNYHWNVKGTNFFALHLLFEQQYKEQVEAVDELAEKIRSMGINVQADLQYFASHSTISLPNKDLSAAEMIKDLIESHIVIINKFYALSEAANAANNKTIDDFAIQRIAAHEQQRWMLLSSV
jgi:starvation-inducible DNA-binding protein